jgi:hypothetical protein
MKRLTLIAWLTVLLALCAWGAVGFFARNISAQESDRTTRVAATEESSTKAAMNVRAHALAQDTEVERTELGDILNVDVVAIADAIEAAGRSIGVPVKVSNVQSESSPPSPPSGPKIQAVGFVVGADGKFSGLMRAVQLFETLPIPSEIERLDISHTPNLDGGPDSWHLNILIRVLTTSAISS